MISVQPFMIACFSTGYNKKRFKSFMERSGFASNPGEFDTIKKPGNLPGS